MPSATRIEMQAVFPDAGLHLQVQRHPSHGVVPLQHSHAFSELVIILGGQGSHAVGDEVHAINAGDIFVILGDTTHGYPETNHLRLVNVLFDPAPLGIPAADLGALPGYHALFMVEPRVRARGKFTNRLRLTVEQLAHATDLVARMEEELRDRRRGYAFMATTYLMQLMAHLARCGTGLERGGTRPVAQISELLSYMERHYAEPLTVADLTEVAHMSRTTLMRVFTRIMGRSPIDHLIRLRISKSGTLLRRTTLSVTEIGFQVGFNDSNYFTRQFRKITSLAPREYRLRRRARRN